jgi:hypothetical protein
MNDYWLALRMTSAQHFGYLLGGARPDEQVRFHSSMPQQAGAGSNGLAFEHALLTDNCAEIRP